LLGDVGAPAYFAQREVVNNSLSENDHQREPADNSRDFAPVSALGTKVLLSVAGWSIAWRWLLAILAGFTGFYNLIFGLNDCLSDWRDWRDWLRVAAGCVLVLLCVHLFSAGITMSLQ
jgi:hypothetical protein